MEIGLRLLGCWGGLQVLMSLIDAVGMLVGLPGLPGGGMPRSYWVWTIAGDVLQGLLCGGLIVAAPRLARKWSRRDEPHEEPRGARPAIGPGDLYHLGCYLRFVDRRGPRGVQRFLRRTL